MDKSSGFGSSERVIPGFMDLNVGFLEKDHSVTVPVRWRDLERRGA